MTTVQNRVVGQNEKNEKKRRWGIKANDANFFMEATHLSLRNDIVY